jgi:Protein of unknown function (DUF2934)
MDEQGRDHGLAEQEIAICAYLIWKHEGQPEGLDKIHWDQAKEQLIICHAHEHWISAPRSREDSSP